MRASTNVPMDELRLLANAPTLMPHDGDGPPCRAPELERRFTCTLRPMHPGPHIAHGTIAKPEGGLEDIVVGVWL